MSTDDARDRAAAALPDQLAASVADGSADLEPYPLPGLSGAVVWRARLDLADHPQQTYVGVPPSGPARLLPDDQAAFFAVVDACGGARIASPDIALGYVLAFLEVTRGPTVIVSPLSDAAGIRWRPGTPAEEQRRADFLAADLVRPPTAQALGDDYRVEIWLVVDQRIQVNTFTVTPDGAIDSSYRVVAQDLPLPIAR